MIGSKHHIVKSYVLHIRLALYRNSGNATMPSSLRHPQRSHKVIMTRALLLAEMMNCLLSALRL